MPVPNVAQEPRNYQYRTEPAPAIQHHVGVPSNIYIDSIPRGAEVRLIPKQNEKGEHKSLGKTPLVVKPADCSTMRFCILMNMDEYLKAVESIPDMKEWIAKFKSSQYFGGHALSSRQFEFDTSESILVQDIQGALKAVGPVYDLPPGQDRLCGVFVPRGVKWSTLFPKMPIPGTYDELKGTWPDQLRNRYRLSEEQVQEAYGSLSRCGHYFATVRDPYQKGIGRQYSITILGPGPSSERVVISATEVRLFPGIND